MTPQLLIETENRIAELWRQGEIPYLTHLSSGNETWLCDFFQEHVKPTDFVFSNHRAHYHALLHGMPPDELVQHVLNGDSMHLFMPRFITSAICAGICPIAVGVAMSIQMREGFEWCWCFIGDGASFEGSFAESVRFAWERNLPITFIIEDNDMSCGVTKAERQQKDFPWPDNVVKYSYTPTHPHAGTAERPVLKWKPQSV